MKSIKQIRESNLEEASVHLDNPFDSKHGPDHKSETKHAETMKKNHGVTTKYHRDSGEMSYHGPKKNLKAALHTHYQTDDENDIKDSHPELYEDVSKKKSSDMARVMYRLVSSVSEIFRTFTSAPQAPTAINAARPC